MLDLVGMSGRTVDGDRRRGRGRRSERAACANSMTDARCDPGRFMALRQVRCLRARSPAAARRALFARKTFPRQRVQREHVVTGTTVPPQYLLSFFLPILPNLRRTCTVIPTGTRGISANPIRVAVIYIYLTVLGELTSRTTTLSRRPCALPKKIWMKAVSSALDGNAYLDLPVG